MANHGSPLRTALLALGIVVTIAACGGGGSAPSTPVITTQPQPQSVVAGGTVSFSVVAGGPPPVRLSWNLIDHSVGDGVVQYGPCTGMRVEGHDQATLVLSDVPLACDGARISVSVDNNQGGVGSDLALLSVLPAPTTASRIALLAGDIGGAGNLDGDVSDARLDQPFASAFDASGTLYIADSGNGLIRKLSPSGSVSTLAGAAGSSSAGVFSTPQGIAVDSAGEVYVADTGRHAIRKISLSGVVSTLAGMPGQSGSDDGAGTAARFYNPSGLVLDAAGNLYVADSANCTVRKITPAGMTSTLAGSPGQCGSADGLGAAALFNQPAGLALDPAGNVFVADSYNHTIRKITPAGSVSTLAGRAGVSGSEDGLGTDAGFFQPTGIVLDAANMLYVSDGANRTVRRITPGGLVSTVAGTLRVAGYVDGPGGTARFSVPMHLSIDGAGNLWVADPYNNVIRKITPTGVVSTVAGRASLEGGTSGTGAAARFNGPTGLATDAAGNTYVADATGNTIRKITPAGVASTLAGTYGVAGSADGAGAAAQFRTPTGVAVDAANIVYVADAGNNTIRKITPAGVVSTLAGLAGAAGSADGGGSEARLNYPSGLAVDVAGTVYVADTFNHLIRKITPAGVVSTLAGTAGSPGGADGTGSAAQFRGPAAVALDAAGQVFVADYGNHTVRKISAAGVVSTLAGSAYSPGSADGIGSAARLSAPTGLSLDSAGNVYVTSFDKHTVRKITQAGVVTTVLGSPLESGIRLGANGRLASPYGIALVSDHRAVITSSHAVLTADLP